MKGFTNALLVNNGREWTSIGKAVSYYNDLAYGNGVWIISKPASSGATNTLYYSTDNGTTWTDANINSGADFSAFCYGNGIWVAGQKQGGNFFYSYNGINWTASTEVSGGSVISIIYGGGYFIASNGGSKGIAYSSNGTTWTYSPIIGYSTNNVCYASDKNKWVASSSETESDGIYYSINGTTWSPAVNAPFSIYVAYGNGKFIACSSDGTGIYYSTDGISWTQSNLTSGSFYCASYGDGLYIASGVVNSKGVMYYSTDGITWTQGTLVTTHAITHPFVSIVYNNAGWIAGNSGEGIFYSVDGKTWIQTSITSGTYRPIVYGNGMNMIGGNNTSYKSPIYIATQTTF
jgi:hypothetical protein